MHGLEPITHIRQRPTDDDAHGIVEIRLLEFVFNAARQDLPCLIGAEF